MTIAIPAMTVEAAASELKLVKPALRISFEDPTYRGNFRGLTGAELIEAQHAVLFSVRKMLAEFDIDFDDNYESSDFAEGYRDYVLPNAMIPTSVIGLTLEKLNIGSGFCSISVDEQVLAEQLDEAGSDDGWATAEFIMKNADRFYLNADRQIAEVTND